MGIDFDLTIKTGTGDILPIVQTKHKHVVIFSTLYSLHLTWFLKLFLLCILTFFPPLMSLSLLEQICVCSLS